MMLVPPVRELHNYEPGRRLEPPSLTRRLERRGWRNLGYGRTIEPDGRRLGVRMRTSTGREARDAMVTLVGPATSELVIVVPSRMVSCDVPAGYTRTSILPSQVFIAPLLM